MKKHELADCLLHYTSHFWDAQLTPEQHGELVSEIINELSEEDLSTRLAAYKAMTTLH